MKFLPYLFFLILINSSCSKPKVKQFEHSGGSITLALDNEPSTYVTREVADVYSSTVLNQIIEGLVGIDPKTTKIIPKLASEWVKSDDGKTYTFTLREGVMFHPHEVFKSDEDRIMTPADVLKTFELGCTVNDKGLAPNAYPMACKSLIKGADEFFEQKAKSISGIKVDGNKITFELIYEDHNFLYKIASVNLAIISKKIYESDAESDVIGTGPFLYDTYKTGDESSLILIKNQDYYLKDGKGNALPYLDSLILIFQSRKLEQLDIFEEGRSDIIFSLPTSRITRMLEGRMEDFNSKPPKLIMNNNALLEVEYYFFNMQDERFKDPKVRKAFNYAFDREEVGREILRNQYNDLGFYGITPPLAKALKGYDFASIKEVSYTYDPEKAKKLLAEAGYPNGKGFGSVN